MHILVVNDDGPPSKVSPYIYPFITTLQKAGHLVSVAIPSTSRSWIGKAHIIESALKASYIDPSTFADPSPSSIPTPSPSPSPEPSSPSSFLPSSPSSQEPTTWPWAIIQNGTPASCVQLGLYALFPTRPPIDLVISGPNHGRNASTIYNLSSGTVGGALEAALCGVRGIAVSFGSKEAQGEEVIAAAARLGTRVVEALSRTWDGRVEVYNLNIPMRGDVESRPVVYTRSVGSYWRRGCLYTETQTGDQTGTGDQGEGKERRFVWNADLTDMKRDLLAAGEGTDAFTVLNGCTSVTPLRANLWHVPGFEGEIQLR